MHKGGYLWIKMSNQMQQALAKFDELNAQDPKSIEVDGEAQPRELVFSKRLDAWIHRVSGNPSLALRLAARCQHLMRFSFPRSSYPEGRIGYLKWRKDLSRKHADLATEILEGLGFDRATIDAVRTINLKQALKTNPDSQAMEDALCLSFLEHEFAEFSNKHDEEKVIDIVGKTWRKMSARGHELALTLPFEGRAKDLIEKALSENSTSPNDENS